MAIIQCPECGGQLSDSAKCCPHCGFKRKKEVGIGTVIVILIAVFFVVFCVFMKIKADHDREEMVMDTFFNSGDGVTISEIAENFEKTVDGEPEGNAEAGLIFESSIEYNENNSVLITYTDDLKMAVAFFFDGTDKQTEFNRVYAVTLLVSEMQDILNDGTGNISLVITTKNEEDYDMGYITYKNGEVGELSSFPVSYEGLHTQEEKVTEEWEFANQQISENMKKYTE